MNLHEYQAKSLLAGMGMPCPKEIAIQQISQLADAWQHIACPSKGAVLKAQVHAGGRGKAGGVKVLKQLPEAQAFVQQMLGSQLVTYQTGPEGQYVSSIWRQRRRSSGRTPPLRRGRPPPDSAEEPGRRPHRGRPGGG